MPNWSSWWIRLAQAAFRVLSQQIQRFPEGLTHGHAKEIGGLSGKPLRERSTEIVSRIYKQTGGSLPIIGSGGIFTARDAYDKIRAGASLVEIYTALIYEGPEVNRKLHSGLRDLLARDGFNHISEAVGANHR